ncbi:hypothetical protein C8R44DRAFT_330305 [Mycena epipterygia]|nr:hypothetical protein C8R44DRAFT_330305 [Mycena epipterygia]
MQRQLRIRVRACHTQDGAKSRGARASDKKRRARSIARTSPSSCPGRNTQDLPFLPSFLSIRRRPPLLSAVARPTPSTLDQRVRIRSPKSTIPRSRHAPPPSVYTQLHCAPRPALRGVHLRTRPPATGLQNLNVASGDSGDAWRVPPIRTSWRVPPLRTWTRLPPPPRADTMREPNAREGVLVLECMPVQSRESAHAPSQGGGGGGGRAHGAHRATLAAAGGWVRWR